MAIQAVQCPHCQKVLTVQVGTSEARFSDRPKLHPLTPRPVRRAAVCPHCKKSVTYQG